MKNVFFAVGIAMLVASCNADEEVMQDPTQAEGAAVAEFKINNPDETVYEGTYADLVSVSQSAKSVAWDLGDGNTSTEAAPRHRYDKCGAYNVRLTVTDASGQETTVEKVVEVACTVPRHRANPLIYKRD